jgi:hypothetical protein
MKAATLLFISLFASALLWSQEKLLWGGGGMLSVGSIIKNYPEFPERGLSKGIQFEIFLKTNGRKEWHRQFHHPHIGLIFSHYNLGNEEILGSVSGMQAFLRIPLFKRNQLNHFFFKPAIGFAWFSKPYDKVKNPENLLMGSHLSNITTMELEYGRRLTFNVEGLISIGFAHFSNGHTSLPNVGINFPSLSAGVRYSPEYKTVIDTIVCFRKQRWRLNAEASLGMQEFGETTEPTDGRKYPVYGASLFLSRTTNLIHSWSLGFTWNYYTSFYDFIKAEELFNKHERWHSGTLILFGGHEFVAGHVGIDTRLGLYVTNSFRNKYSREIIHFVEQIKLLNTNRLGLNFYLYPPAYQTTNAWIGMFIKANAGQADFVGLSAGIRF